MHRVVRDLRAYLEQQDAVELEMTGLTMLEAALGPCHEPLPSVLEMMDLPDPAVERRGRALLKVCLPR
jgi:hypothetical protein